MRKHLKKIFEKIEKSNSSIYSLIVSLFAIIAIRGFLENLSNNTKGFIKIVQLSSVFLHYISFYVTGLFGFILSFYFLSNKSRKNIIQTTKVFCYGLVLIWIPPVFDLISTLGKGKTITYMFFNPNSSWYTLFYLFTKPPGISDGERIELILMFCLTAIYFYYKNKNFVKTIINMFFNYLIVFFILTVPSLFLLASNFFKYGLFSYVNIGEKISNTARLFSFQLFSDVVSFKRIVSNISNTSLFITKRVLENQILDFFSSWIFITIFIFLLNIWFYLYNKNKFLSFWKNSRPERILYYLSLIFVGFFIANKLGVYYWNWSLFNTLSLDILIISLIASWLLQVNINDIHDKKIDAVSNTNRPLLLKTLSVKDLKTYNFILILIIIFTALTLNYEIIFLLTCWNGAYFLYSAPPFRLKKYPFISNLLIGITGIVTVLIGFSIASGGYGFGKFSNYLFFIITAIITLISPVKDIKDVKGDAAQGIKTIPVLLGEKIGKLTISFMVILAAILTSFIIKNLFFTAISITSGIFAVILINRERFKEIYLFLLFFIYIIVMFNF